MQANRTKIVLCMKAKWHERLDECVTQIMIYYYFFLRGHWCEFLKMHLPNLFYFSEIYLKIPDNKNMFIACLLK